MTLRLLVPMALGRQRSDWSRAAVMTCWIINRNGWNREPVTPQKIIPAGLRPPKPKTAEMTPEELEADRAHKWGVIDRKLGITEDGWTEH